MVLTEEDELNFKQSKQCFYCNEPFFAKHDQNLKKCRDHCHITGKYRCAAHSLCNVNINNSYTKVPVFCHNMKGYDSRFYIIRSE